MPTRSYLWGMGIGGTLTLAAFLLVLFYFDPTITGSIGVGLFFVSLLSSLLLWLTLIIYLIRHRMEPDHEDLFSLSLRHAGLATFAIGAILLLQGLKVLQWWNFGLILIVAILVESYARIKVE